MNSRHLSRRRFLRHAAYGAAAVTVTPILSMRSAYAASQGDPNNFVVVVNLLGGNDGLNTVVPAHLTPYVDRRANINLVENLPAGEVLRDLDGRFALHYKLANLKTMWDDNDLHVVNKVSYPSPNQSHFTSQDIYSFGIRNNDADGDGRGWLGRFADAYCSDPSEPLGVIAVGVGKRRDFDSEATAPVILSNVEGFRVQGDEDYESDHLLRVKTVKDALATDPVPLTEPALTIFDANTQAYQLVEQVQQGVRGWTDPGTYPNSNIGSYMRTISQLLHAHDLFKTKIFYTGYGGFDTHSAQHTGGTGQNRHELLMERLDDALGAFRVDMQNQGRWGNCVIVVISEFGRRVFENGSIGTDHGHGNAFLVAGGAVKGRAQGGGLTGEIVESDIATNNTLPFGHDFRDVYANLVANHIGVSATPLFPDPAYVPSTSGEIDLV